MLSSKSCTLNPPLDLKSDLSMAAGNAFTTTTTILSVTPATSVESTLERMKDGHPSCRLSCTMTPTTQMGKAHQSSTAGLGQRQSFLRVQNHLNHIPPFTPLHTKESDTKSSPAQYESNQQAISHKFDFDSNKLVPDSNQSNPTVCTIATTSSTIFSGSTKEFCNNLKEKEMVSTDQQTREKPIFNHVIPLVSPIVNPMLICPFVNPRSTITAPNPVTRISSSSSKVSDV